MTSAHSVPILKENAFDVQFTPEWTVSGSLVNEVWNKVYFQVISTETKAPIEFHKAEVVANRRGSITVMYTIKHIANGMSHFRYVPLDNMEMYFNVY